MAKKQKTSSPAPRKRSKLVPLFRAAIGVLGALTVIGATFVTVSAARAAGLQAGCEAGAAAIVTAFTGEVPPQAQVSAACHEILTKK